MDPRKPNLDLIKSEIIVVVISPKSLFLLSNNVTKRAMMDINKFTFYSPLNNFGREMLEVTYISLHFLITFA